MPPSPQTYFRSSLFSILVERSDYRNYVFVSRNVWATKTRLLVSTKIKTLTYLPDSLASLINIFNSTALSGCNTALLKYFENLRNKYFADQYMRRGQAEVMSVTPDKLDPYVDRFKPLCSSGHMNAWYGFGWWYWLFRQSIDEVSRQREPQRLNSLHSGNHILFWRYVISLIL